MNKPSGYHRKWNKLVIHRKTNVVWFYLWWIVQVVIIIGPEHRILVFKDQMKRVVAMDIEDGCTKACTFLNIHELYNGLCTFKWLGWQMLCVILYKKRWGQKEHVNHNRDVGSTYIALLGARQCSKFSLCINSHLENNIQ